jgi:YgiT-type zinc finger domain-containing protein
MQERLVRWREAHPRATLREIETETDRQLAVLRSALVSRLAHLGQDDTRPHCPSCGAPMQRVGRRARTVTTAQDAVLTLRGPGYRCPACGAGLFPPG